MPLFKKTRPDKGSIVVQTARSSSHPFSAIDSYVPLAGPEMRLYDAMREAIPIIDAAVCKIIRLVGGFSVECDNKKAGDMLNSFLRMVPTGATTSGINSFIEGFLDQLLMYGTAVGEMVPGSSSGSLCAVCNADLTSIELKLSDNPLKVAIYSKNAGKSVLAPYPERILLASMGCRGSNPLGTSILKGLPFVSSILLKIYNTIGENWERMGNPRFSITCRSSDGFDGSLVSERASAVANEWAAAMSDSSGVRDFVSVGDVDIKVIGADGQIMDSSIPVKHMLEQIIAKTGLPPFMLGLSWSATERMSSQQADILTSELEYYRSILDPVLTRICKEFLRREGFVCSFDILWSDISLQDEVELARARLLRAQAAQIEDKLRVNE